MFQGLSIATEVFSVTPGTSFSPKKAVALYVGGEGDVELTDNSGNTVTFAAVPAGSWIPVVAVSVESANTTATNLVGVQ